MIVTVDYRAYDFNRFEWRKMKRWLEVGEEGGVIRFLCSRFYLRPVQAMRVLRAVARAET